MSGLARGSLWLGGAALFIAATVALAAWLGRPVELTPPAQEIVGGVRPMDLDMERVAETARLLSSHESRLTGYPGEQATLAHILAELDALGHTERDVMEFTTAVPMVEHAELATPSGLRVPLHPVWPNLARTSQTPPEGLTGPLVDVGDARDASLNGKPLAGSLAVVDWDTGSEWLSVPEFGGKAVLFRGNPNGSRQLSALKYLTSPADIPRFYVAEEDLALLDQALAEGEATVTCTMDWRDVPARNVLVPVSRNNEGSRDPNHAPVIFSAYYDAISVVPSRAPGAEQAVGAAVLLEMARVIPQRNPQRPVYLLFTSGHGQMHQGMVEFTRALSDARAAGWRGGEDSVLARMGAPGLIVALDLSTRSDQFGVFAIGEYPAMYQHIMQPRFQVLGLKLAEFARQYRDDPSDEKRPSFLDCITPPLGRGWWTYSPYSATFESEMPALAGFPAIALSTVNDERRSVDTPNDTFDRLDMELLGRQLLAEPGERVGLLNICMALANWSGPYVSSPLENKMARLSGRVTWLDDKRNYVPSEPLAGAPVFMKTQWNRKFLAGTRGIVCDITDEDGDFHFDALADLTISPFFQQGILEAYGVATRDFVSRNGRAMRRFLNIERGPDAPDLFTQEDGTTVSDEEAAAIALRELPLDGSIIYGVDMARAADYPYTFSVTRLEQSRNVVTFPCRTVTLLGLTDPRGYVPLREVGLLEASTKSPPFQWGESSTDFFAGNTVENLVTIWTDPGTRLMMTLGLALGEKRLVLINGTDENPEGEGFVLSELTSLPSMVLQGASDMTRLNETRLARLRAQGVNNPRIEEMQAQALVHLEAAREALAAQDYLGYRVESERAWALGGRAYAETLSMINNMIRGVVFYLALLLPFAYCLERLVLASTTIRGRITGMVSVFLLAFVVLALVHPAFRFTMTPMAVLLAFVLLCMAGIVSMLLVGRVDGMLKERKQATSGLHEDARNVGNVTARAVDLGIANIRRRPQRGMLTGATIVLVTFTLLSFTSLVPVVTISTLNHPKGEAVYEGMLARQRDWLPVSGPLHDSFLRRFDRAEEFRSSRGEDGAVVAARAWFYSDHTGDLSMIDLTAVGDRAEGDTSDRRFVATALLAMEPDEPLVTGVGDTLVAGRWFQAEHEQSIILTAHGAAQLGLDETSIGTRVRLFGRDLELVGLVDGAAFDKVVDLDGEALTPVNFVMQRETQSGMGARSSSQDVEALKDFIHYSADSVAIVPYRHGTMIGATLRSVAIRMGESLDPAEEAAGYARRSGMTMLASTGDRVMLYSALDSSQLRAAGEVGIPVLLGFIMVLGTMLGSVYERRREIFVYNSVGLSPTSVSSLFLAEAFVYAVLGAGLGYLLGQVLSKLLLVTGLLSGLTLNYSAGTTIFVTVLTMAIVLLSTVYPARQAYSAAIPDASRDRDPDAGDEEGETIRTFLPFVASPGSLHAMQMYLWEYLDGIQGVSVGELAVENLSWRLEEQEGQLVPVLQFRAWLAPFDLGISHDAELRIVRRPEAGVWQYHLSCVHHSGEQGNWRRLSPRFITAMRKQLLMWRVVPPADQARYEQRGQQQFAPKEAARA